MNIKTTTATICAFFCAGLLRADDFAFLPERFSSITFVTTKGHERITVETGTKQEGSEAKIFESRLAPAGAGAYRTPEGTIFTLKHLSKPIINDGNRHINSGDWQLTISGSGPEFARLKRNMPKVTFGETPPLTYLGTKKQP